MKTTYNDLVAKYTPDSRFRNGVAVLGDKEWHRDSNLAIRWDRSNNIVPEDILEMAVVDGTITMNDLFISKKAKLAEFEVFLKGYIAHREKNGYSEEELMEIEAESDGEELVDFFTGKEIRTGKQVLWD